MNTLTLISNTTAPCGIEAFARQLATEFAARRDGRQTRLPISGRLSDLAAAWREMRHTDLVIMNLPIAAWKRLIVQPFLALVLARLRGKEVLIVLHEWRDLDWRRRVVLAPYLLVATRLLLSAPRVDRQLRSSPISRVTTRRRGIVPIPPNLERPLVTEETALTSKLEAIRRANSAIIGQFGSIYPKKRNVIALDIAAELKRRGRDVFTVFVGDFVRGQDNLEEEFAEQVRALGLEGEVMITGYVERASELFAILERVDVFVYSFEDGLSSNRSSVLTCLQASKPVVVNAPRSPNEFDHHPTFCKHLATDRLRLVATDAGVAELAEGVQEAIGAHPSGPLVDYRRMWSDVLDVVRRGASADRMD